MKHYILVKFKPGEFDRSVVETSRAILEKLPGAVEGFRGVTIFENCADREENYDMMIEMELAGLETFAAYRDHPYHKEYIAYATPKMISRVVFDRA